MTKDNLYSRLNAFISNGYLEENYTSEKFSAFCFLDTAYVGFCHDGSEQDESEEIRAVILTDGEIQTVKRSGAYGVIDNARDKEELCLTFSEKLLERCTSSAGRSKLKRMMKKFYCPNKKSTQNFDFVPTSFSEGFGAFALSLTLAGRSKNIKEYKHRIKKVKAFVMVILICSALILGSIMTSDWRKRFDPDRASVAFDKNASDYDYSYIEADIFAPFISLSPRVISDEESNIENYHGEYYLWGNSQTGDFGILRFDLYSDEVGITGDLNEPTVLEEPVMLYGEVFNTPDVISSAYERTQKKAEKKDQPISGHTLPMPDGTEVWVPDVTIDTDIEIPLFDMHESHITDNSKSALSFFAEKGILVDSAEMLGAKYIETTVAPATVKSTLNKTLDNVMFLLLSASFVLFVITVISAGKADKCLSALASINKGIYDIIERFIPVVTNGNTIHIRSEGFMFWISELCGKDVEPFECTASLPLRGDAPAIILLEDGNKTAEAENDYNTRNSGDVYKTREYVLQTEGDESFDGKYFFVSVRLGVHTGLNAPVVQIDGFISDTSEAREMTRNDIGYRMEGHFLALGGSRSEYAYDKVYGQDLVAKGLKYQGYTTPANVRLVGICPECKKSFAFHGYAVYMAQDEVAYSDDGLDCCAVSGYDLDKFDKKKWSYSVDGKTFRYYNSFSCPHCGTPYIDYKKHPEIKQFGVSACVHLGRELYRSK